VLSTASLEEEVWSTPALVPGVTIVRSQKAVYALIGE